MVGGTIPKNLSGAIGPLDDDDVPKLSAPAGQFNDPSGINAMVLQSLIANQSIINKKNDTLMQQLIAAQQKDPAADAAKDLARSNQEVLDRMSARLPKCTVQSPGECKRSPFEG